MQKKPFAELGLSPEILKAVSGMGFEEASHIQSQAIPVLLAGSDVVGQSQTGSGKTAAFAIPAIEKVDPSLRAPQVLILCPTRELAMQVAEEVAKLAAFKKGVRELPVYGGASYDRQLRGLREGAHIVIGTPGRVMDHLERGTLKMDQVKMVILDEADRMLDMGFVDDIRKILEQAPKTRQTVFFSATLPRPIQGLIKTFTNNPVNVTVEAHAKNIPAIDQVYYEVDRRNKVDVLCRLIDLGDVKFGIIFCATKMMVDELTEHLCARGYAADKLHGDMTQQMRERVTAKFRRKGIEFLVATDVAARGLDVDDIEVVFNYDLPNDGEDYTHRIGRTGRAGRSGRAVTFVAGREIYKMQSIIRFTNSKVRREKVPSEEEVEAQRENRFADALRKTLEEGKYEKQDALIGRLLDQGHSATDIASALMHILQPKEEKPPQPVRPERAERPERSERFERSERAERPARAAGPRREGGYEANRGPRNDREPHQSPDRVESPVSHEPGMVRLAFGAGREHGVQPGGIVGVIIGTTKLPKEAIGAIRLQAKQAYVDVAEEHVDTVISKLTGITFQGRKLWCKRAEAAKPARTPERQD